MYRLSLFFIGNGKVDLNKAMDGVKAVTGELEVNINIT